MRSRPERKKAAAASFYEAGRQGRHWISISGFSQALRLLNDFSWRIKKGVEEAMVLISSSLVLFSVIIRMHAFNRRDFVYCRNNQSASTSQNLGLSQASCLFTVDSM